MRDKRCSFQINMTWKENYKNEVEKIFLQMLASISHQYYLSLNVFYGRSKCSICRIPALRKWNQIHELTKNLCYYSVSFHLHQSEVSLRTDTTLWSAVENLKRKIILMGNWHHHLKKYLILIPNWNFFLTKNLCYYTADLYVQLLCFSPEDQIVVSVLSLVFWNLNQLQF